MHMYICMYVRMYVLLANVMYLRREILKRNITRVTYFAIFLHAPIDVLSTPTIDCARCRWHRGKNAALVANRAPA